MGGTFIDFRKQESHRQGNLRPPEFARVKASTENSEHEWSQEGLENVRGTKSQGRIQQARSRKKGKMVKASREMRPTQVSTRVRGVWPEARQWGLTARIPSQKQRAADVRSHNFQCAITATTTRFAVSMCQASQAKEASSKKGVS